MNNFEERRRQFDKEFNAQEKRINRWLHLGVVLSVGLMLVVGSLLVWAFISVVNWVVTK